MGMMFEKPDQENLDESQPPTESSAGWINRPGALALFIATGVALYLCYQVVSPFLPAIAWALALAIIGFPLQRWIRRRISRPALAAGACTFLVALVIVLPVVFVSNTLTRQATEYATSLSNSLSTGQWRKSLKRFPRLEHLLDRLGPLPGIPQKEGSPSDTDAQPAGEPSLPVSALQSSARLITNSVSAIVTTAGWLGMQLFITFLTLFFFLRDGESFLRKLRGFTPLADSEIDDVFRRVDDTIHATIYGSVVVAFVQGFMGGLMFWWLGLPTPLFWGSVMGMLAVVPVLGTFVIWAPTAAYLALCGEWGKAALLAGWGAIAIGLIDNFLYPFLVGSRIRFHTLLVFFAITGGVIAFGACGVILGPVLLAVTDALLDVWNRRTSKKKRLELGTISR